MITIESYLRSGRTAEEYIQDLEQVGYSISDTTRAQIETWFQQQAAGQVTVPRLGYAFDLPEGLVRHINTP